MTEVEATVESEHVPEPKWPERIIVCHCRDFTGEDEFDVFVPRFAETAEDEAKGWCNSQGYTAYRILRVSPPVERRVSIDWEAVGMDGVGLTRAQELTIEAHARIVEEPKR